MFGYIAINQAEMKYKDYEVYESYYCGLCHGLSENFGKRGQLTLSYDMTFLSLLLDGLYEPETKTEIVNCVVHPFKKHRSTTSKMTAYAASMNLLLSYYKCKDDWEDEKKKKSFAMMKALDGKMKTIHNAYPEKAKIISEKLAKISELEKANEEDLDLMSGLFGDIMAEIFAYQKDEWEHSLRKIGFYLGKYIYLLDAYEDVEEDIEKGNYNPLKKKYQELTASDAKTQVKDATAKKADVANSMQSNDVTAKQADVADSIQANDATAKQPDEANSMQTNDATAKQADDIAAKNVENSTAHPGQERFAQDCRILLTMMIAECSREFEYLPIIKNVEILRNILYSGVWSRYTTVTAKRLGLENKEQNDQTEQTDH